MTAKLTKEERLKHGPFRVTTKNGRVLVWCGRCKRHVWNSPPRKAQTLARYVEDGLLGRWVVRTTKARRRKLAADLRTATGTSPRR